MKNKKLLIIVICAVVLGLVSYFIVVAIQPKKTTDGLQAAQTDINANSPNASIAQPNNQNNVAQTQKEDQNKTAAKVNPLNDNDFLVTYNGFAITENTSEESMFKTLGHGTAGDDNNWGYVGYINITSDREAHTRSYKYPKDKPIIEVFTESPDYQGEYKIVRVSIANTNRGIKVNDSVDKLISVYGKPISTSPQANEYFYEYNGKTLHFWIDSKQKTVQQIWVEFPNNKVK